MKIQVSHTLAHSEAEKAETYRVTVHAVSYIDRAHYFALAREVESWYTERTGLHLEDETDDPEFIALRNLCYYRAEMLASVDRKRTSEGTAYLCEWKNGKEGAEFERRNLPAEWTTLDGMADKMPSALFDKWLEATRELNAGVLPTIPDFFGQATTSRNVID